MQRFIFIFLFFLLILSHVHCQSLKEVQQNLKGKWISVQDTSYIITFNKEFLIEENKNDTTKESFRYFISNKNCGVDFKLCSNKCFYLKKRNAEGDIVLCYLIKNANKNSLTLIYEGGQVLEFLRPENY
jgi:hypothetical protein